MKKRGQVSIFMIIGMVIIIGFLLFYYLQSSNSKNKSAASNANSIQQNDVQVVKTYVENCIKIAVEDALFNRTGPQAGYIDPQPNARYIEPGLPAGSLGYTNYLGDKVPYYLRATCTKYCKSQICSPPPCVCIEWRCSWSYNKHVPDSTPELNIIGGKIENYIKAEFPSCFDLNAFEGIGIEVTMSDKSPKVGVSINSEDVSVTMNYTINAEKGGQITTIKSFIAIVPIRLKKLYDGSISLINKIESVKDTPFTSKVPYNIAGDCASYDKNGHTNVYSKPVDSDSDIIQFVDFSTYNNHYFKSYIFQFAVKNIDVIGICAG